MPARSSLAVLIAAALAAPLARGQDLPPSAPAGVAGQEQPPQGPVQPFTDPSQLFSGRTGAFFGLGFGKINGDFYASTTINTDLNLGQVGLGLQLPLNLLVLNEGPDCSTVAHSLANPCTRDEKTYFGVLRRRDWDEPTDYLKLIRYVRYGHKRDPFYFQAGQLWGATIGHGTLVNRYANSLNLDHPKTGLVLDVNTDYFGVETLIDSFANPTLFGGRAYVKPFGGTYILRGFAVGASLVTDRSAPLCPGGPPCTFATDSTGNIVLDDSNSRLFLAGGVDIEYELLRNSLISLIPYVDANRLAGAGNGLHAGILSTIRLPIPILDIGLDARFEYRVMQAGYIPEYFDQTYDLGRFNFAVISHDSTGKVITLYAPKLQVAENLHAHVPATAGVAVDNTGTIQGYYGELAFNFAGLLQIGGVYQDYQTDNGASLGLFATFPKIEIVKLSAYYLRKNFNGLSDAFTLDERSLLAASAAYKVFGPLYVRFDFSRQWVTIPDATPGTPQIKAVDAYTVGLASYLPF